MYRVFAITALVVLGALFQNATGFLDNLNPTPEVYSKPIWYSITRNDATIAYQAAGERLIECIHAGPLTADLFDSTGGWVSRELVRRNNMSERSPHVKTDRNNSTQDSSIVGTPKVDSKPRKFEANSLIIVSDIKTLSIATSFIVRAECKNTQYGRLLGKFGPFPIPKDGETQAYFPEVLKPQS